jgi:hypothetical protein
MDGIVAGWALRTAYFPSSLVGEGDADEVRVEAAVEGRGVIADHSGGAGRLRKSSKEPTAL